MLGERNYYKLILDAPNPVSFSIPPFANSASISGLYLAHSSNDGSARIQLEATAIMYYNLLPYTDYRQALSLYVFVYHTEYSVPINGRWEMFRFRGCAEYYLLLLTLTLFLPSQPLTTPPVGSEQRAGFRRRRSARKTGPGLIANG